MKSEYDVVIVGAGVIGLYTAHHLARGLDPRRILVVDRSTLALGASGRNGGGVRQQWETVPTMNLARESVHAYRRFAADFGYNPWFRQGGYLFLAFSETEVASLRKVEAIGRGVHLPVRWLGPREVQRCVPGINPSGLQGGSYLSSDGVILPFPVIWGLAASLRDQGVDIQLRTDVQAIERSGGRVTGVRTSAGSVRTSRVVNAAGGWSSEVTAMAKLLPHTHPTLHEILATEPLTPFLDPMVVTLRRGVYFSQTMRGEVVGGMTLDHGPEVRGMASTPRFLFEMSRELVHLLPRMRRARILRAWAGYYDDTPDGLPVLGEEPHLKGFHQANGLGGHGFMLAPAATRLVAEGVLEKRSDQDGKPFAPDRFGNGDAPRAMERLQLG